MAAKKSDKYPHQWPDGTWHSIPWEQTKRAMAGAVVNPPPGSYDPNLDAQLGSTRRNLRDLIADIGGGVGDDPLGTQRIRAQDDYLAGLGELKLGRERDTEDYNTGVGDVNRTYGRSLNDLLTARTQGKEDYDTNVATMQRNYRNLGIAQGEAQRAAGAMAGSGAALQAARKRAENEAIERKPLDTAFQRFNEQSTLAETRLGEDKKSTLDRLKLAYDRGGADYDTNVLKLGQGFTRQDQDWTTQLERAKRETQQFGSDTLNAKVAQFLANNPGQPVPIDYPAPPAAPTAPVAQGQTLTAAPGAPGAKYKVTKRRGKKYGTWSNAVTGP